MKWFLYGSPGTLPGLFWPVYIPILSPHNLSLVVGHDSLEFNDNSTPVCECACVCVLAVDCIAGRPRSLFGSTLSVPVCNYHQRLISHRISSRRAPRFQEKSHRLTRRVFLPAGWSGNSPETETEGEVN